MKIENMVSSSGNKVANQFILKGYIHNGVEGVAFQSYDSIIAFESYKDGSVVLDEKYWDYSKTTGKYRNIFLMETKAETEKKIKNGTYTLANLNQ